MHRLVYYKRIGSECQVMVISSKKVLHKLNTRTETADFLCYGKGTKSYWVLLKTSNKNFESREVTFNKKTFPEYGYKSLYD
jgi:hypothetical protein